MSEKEKQYKPPKAQSLLRWYDQHHRHLPWRAEKGESLNPYHVWLSEIMLQQTVVATVIPYFLKFIKRWPVLDDLAQAKHDDVLKMWAGLGYYRRAHFLHACAQTVVSEYGGLFPDTEKELLALPGVGPYTAAAIRTIAFDKKANVVDGNVERIMSRLYRVNELMPVGKEKLKDLASQCLPSRRFGDYAQGLMDLGAMVCTPRAPKCDVCPWRLSCAAYLHGDMESYPKRLAKKPKPKRKATAFVLFDTKGCVFIRKRGEKGLLAGMMEIPTSGWDENHTYSFDQAPVDTNWRWINGHVHHVFTHFELEIRVAVASMAGLRKMGGRWILPTEAKGEALPSVMQKILKHVISGDHSL